MVRRQVSSGLENKGERKSSAEAKFDEDDVEGSASKATRKRTYSLSAAIGRKFSPQKMSFVLETAAVEAQRIMAWYAFL